MLFTDEAFVKVDQFFYILMGKMLLANSHQLLGKFQYFFIEYLFLEVGPTGPGKRG